ncbi:uncharacterized protein [Nicotiana sylvestris]|uniref:uncharacterized protein n=1 Tax=Nicotiana sylvestris TaxID=4096 RepID=UPI00388C4659
MAGKDLDMGGVDPSKEIIASESKLKEEVLRLKGQMAGIYQAWIRGRPPPLVPANYTESLVTIPPLSQIQLPTTVDVYLQPFHTPPTKTTSYPAPLATHAFVAPPPATFPRSSNKTMFKIPDAQHYAPEPTFKSLRNMQGIGSQMSVSYKDLCLFPDIQLPAGFKMPKFDLYNGRGDPVAHLRGYCSKMRGVGGKDKLLMAYFSQSLSGAALEWYICQDASRWYTWDDMTQAFARQFQYNIEIVPDRMSLTNMEKKPNESFREYGLRWREQTGRVNPPREENEMVKYFLQAQEPTYFKHLISVVGKAFNDVVKIEEMVKDGLNSSKIMSYSALKFTTRVIQNDIGNLLGQKEHGDVAMVVS